MWRLPNLAFVVPLSCNDGAGRTVGDGPFAHPCELVAGFWLWEVKDMDEAGALVKRCPNPMPEPCEIEIRSTAETPDFQ